MDGSTYVGTLHDISLIALLIESVGLIHTLAISTICHCVAMLRDQTPHSADYHGQTNQCLHLRSPPHPIAIPTPLQPHHLPLLHPSQTTTNPLPAHDQHPTPDSPPRRKGTAPTLRLSTRISDIETPGRVGHSWLRFRGPGFAAGDMAGHVWARYIHWCKGWWGVVVPQNTICVSGRRDWRSGRAEGRTTFDDEVGGVGRAGFGSGGSGGMDRDKVVWITNRGGLRSS